jgi:hypothetical protein
MYFSLCNIFTSSIEFIYPHFFTMKISGEDLPASVTPSILVPNVSSLPYSQMLQFLLFTTVGDQFPHPYHKAVVNNNSWFHKFLNIDGDVNIFVG